MRDRAPTNIGKKSYLVHAQEMERDHSDRDLSIPQGGRGEGVYPYYIPVPLLLYPQMHAACLPAHPPRESGSKSSRRVGPHPPQPPTIDRFNAAGFPVSRQDSSISSGTRLLHRGSRPHPPFPHPLPTSHMSRWRAFLIALKE